MQARKLIPLLIIAGCTIEPQAFNPPYVTLACEQLKTTAPPGIDELTGPIQPYTEFICGSNGWEIRKRPDRDSYAQVPVANDRDGDGAVDLRDFAALQVASWNP